MSLKRAVYDNYVTSWENALWTSGKLSAYRLFKSDFKLENYLCFSPVHVRINLTKLRISSHYLQIEMSRFSIPITPRHLRLCINCPENILEDEFHVLMEYSKFSNIRDQVVHSLNDSTIFGTLNDRVIHIVTMN